MSSKSDNVVSHNNFTSNGGLSASTINRILACISSFYDWVTLNNSNINNPIINVVDYKIVLTNESYKGMLSFAKKGNQMKSRFLKFEDINFRKRELSIVFREDNPNGARIKNSKDRIV